MESKSSFLKIFMVFYLCTCTITFQKISGRSCHFVVCPTCGSETPLPIGGIAALPLNYVILRKMTNRESANSVLCELCCADNKVRLIIRTSLNIKIYSYRGKPKEERSLFFT